MERSGNGARESRKQKGLGHCRHFFWLGVAFDAMGVAMLLTGIFADLRYEALLYLGSIFIFLSLLWWFFWYTGNIELRPEEGLTWPYGAPSTTMADALTQICSVTTTLARIRRGRRHRSLMESTASLLTTTLTGQVHKQLSMEKPDKVRMKNVEKRGDTEDFGREDLDLDPEAAKSSKGLCAPGPGAGTLGPEAGQPSITLVQPEFTPSRPNRPLPPSILFSKSLPVVSFASKSLPSVTFASTTETVVPLSTTSQRLYTLGSKIQTTAPEVSQSHNVVATAAQTHLQVPVTLESNFQHLAPTFQTQPPPVQASQAQVLASQVSPVQLLPAPSFQTQPVDLKVTGAQDSQALYKTQQACKSSDLVEEVALSQSSHAQEPPPAQEELSQEVSGTEPLLLKSLTPVTEAQQSVPQESAPGPTTENSHPF